MTLRKFLMSPVTEPLASWPIIAQEFDRKIMQPLLRFSFFFLQYDISCCLPLLNIGCLIIIWTGLNVKIRIVQKVYKWWIWSFSKMIPWLGNHFGKRSDLSLVYFLKYCISANSFRPWIVSAPVCTVTKGHSK